MKLSDLSEFLDDLSRKTVHVVGFASTECTAFVQLVGERTDCSIVIHDFSPDLDTLRRSFDSTHVATPRAERETLYQTTLERSEVRLREHYLNGIDRADLVFVTQSWDLYPQNEPIAALLERTPDKICTLMDLYLAFLPCPIVAITGTNGKTTVASIAANLLTAAGVEVAVSGNHRYHEQLLPRIDQLSSRAVAVLEVSHKHLARLQRGPGVAVITNITADHLDQFDSLADYEARKSRLLSTQKSNGVAILNHEDPTSRRVASLAPGRVVWVSSERCPAERGECAWLEGEELVWRNDSGVSTRVPRSALRAPGRHNTLNALLAMSAVAPWTQDPEQIADGLSSFRGVKHRLELLRTIDGVRIFDDTASTSPHATAAGIEALCEGGKEVTVIVGGDAKDNDYDVLRQRLLSSNARLVLMPGSAGAELRAGSQELEGVHCETLRDALTAALELTPTGGAVLVSPAGGGFHHQVTSTGAGLRSLVRRWGRD